MNVLDGGGGSGSTLVNLLKSKCARKANATIYDYPGSTSALAQTRKNILKDIKQKVSFVEGNFLSRGPTLENLDQNVSFDLIVLGWILHDWPDNTSVQILRKLHSCLKENGKLFILEDIKSEKNEVISNLIMFLMMKGQERNLTQFKRIFRDAKFKIEKILTPISGSRSLMVLSRL
jgi:ubiquinone/menaquinone biosynthesis C-methylase UbiE